MFAWYIPLLERVLIYSVYALILFINLTLVRITIRVCKKEWSEYVAKRRSETFRRKLAVCVARSFVGCEKLEMMCIDRTRYFYNTKTQQVEYIYKQGMCKVYQFCVK